MSDQDYMDMRNAVSDAMWNKQITDEEGASQLHALEQGMPEEHAAFMGQTGPIEVTPQDVDQQARATAQQAKTPAMREKTYLNEMVRQGQLDPQDAQVMWRNTEQGMAQPRSQPPRPQAPAPQVPQDYDMYKQLSEQLFDQYNRGVINGVQLNEKYVGLNQMFPEAAQFHAQPKTYPTYKEKLDNLFEQNMQGTLSDPKMAESVAELQAMFPEAADFHAPFRDLETTLEKEFTALDKELGDG